jgi:predicted membrane protein
MMFTAKISKTAAGDEALQLALDGVLDSVSVGVNPTKTRANEDGSVTVLAADWIELSMVPVPAFAGAVITDIAASIHHEPEETDNNEIQEPTEETEPMSEVTVPAVEATIPTAAIPAQPKRNLTCQHLANILAAMHIGGTTFENVSAAARDFMRSKQSAFEAAAGDVLTTDTVGLACQFQCSALSSKT